MQPANSSRSQRIAQAREGKPVSLAPAGEGAAARRNVLLIIADDHGLDTAAYGNPVIQTPNLDRLASEGIRFSNAFCTTASCSASRSVIFTGLHNHANGQYGHAHSYNHFSLQPWVTPVPRLLGEAGYKTGIVGKFHVNPPERFAFHYEASGRKAGGGRDGQRMAMCMREFLGQCGEHPFMLVMGFSDPHRSGRGFANEGKYHESIKPVVYSPGDVTVPPFLPDQPEVRQELAEYHQAVSRMDQGVGFILDELERSGRADETLVIYISDNGIPFPGAKTCVYDPGIRMPMIVRRPGLNNPGMANHAMVSFTDLVPTILEWTGAPPPKYRLRGRSILPVLDEPGPAGWDEVYFSHTFHEITMYYPSRGVRTRRYKYIHNLAHNLTFPFASDLYASPTWQGVLERRDESIGKRPVEAYLNRPEEELYDLESDPDEIHNLAQGKPRYEPVLEQLRHKTLRFREETGDPWIQGTPGMEPHRFHAG